MAAPHRDSGFTLMEALVAVVIFASASIALQTVFTRGGLGLRVSASETRALEVGRNAMSKAEYPGPSDALRETSGESDGYAWTAIVTRYEAPEGGMLDMKVEAFWLDVDVSWIEKSQPGRERVVSLRTLKLGQVP